LRNSKSACHPSSVLCKTIVIELIAVCVWVKLLRLRRERPIEDADIKPFRGGERLPDKQLNKPPLASRSAPAACPQLWIAASSASGKRRAWSKYQCRGFTKRRR
jgi:hypothetical protein